MPEASGEKERDQGPPVGSDQEAGLITAVKMVLTITDITDLYRCAAMAMRRGEFLSAASRTLRSTGALCQLPPAEWMFCS